MSVGDTTAAAQPPFDVQATLKIYAVVLSVGILCGVAIVSVYEVTKPIIQRNKIAMRQGAILNVLPAAETSAAFQWNEESGQFEATDSSVEGEGLVFAGYDAEGELVGMAIETKGMGYQDFIRVLYGYSPQSDAIIGIRVLESRETPGLGDRIEKDANFLKNFESLDVRLNADKTEPENPIEFVKPGNKTDPWQIDGITGATISSEATADMLRDSSLLWLPRVANQLPTFTSSATEQE